MSACLAGVLGSSSVGSTDKACCKVTAVLLLLTLYDRYITTTHTSALTLDTKLDIKSITTKAMQYLQDIAIFHTGAYLQSQT